MTKLPFDADLGPRYTPSEAAPLLGMNAKTVQALCSAKGITHRRTYGPSGQPRYQISALQIAAFNRAHTQEAAS